MTLVAESLDLSRLPAPNLISIDFEADRLARMAVLVQLFDAAGIPYEVEKLHANPGAIHQRLDNNREMLVKIAQNDLYKQTLIAYAVGGSLDWFAANFHFMPRMAGETDQRFRRRIQLENENKAGGRLSGYKLECMNASLDVADVGAWVDRRDIFEPTVRLATMVASAAAWILDPAAPINTARLLRTNGGGTGVAPSALVSLVQAHIDQDTIKQATDIVAVQSVAIIEVALVYTIFHRKGPDPTLLRTSSAKAVAGVVDERHEPHRDLPLSAITAAGSVGGVDRLVIANPSADVISDLGQLVFVSSITVESAYADG